MRVPISGGLVGGRRTGGDGDSATAVAISGSGSALTIGAGPVAGRVAGAGGGTDGGRFDAVATGPVCGRGGGGGSVGGFLFTGSASVDARLTGGGGGSVGGRFAGGGGGSVGCRFAFGRPIGPDVDFGITDGTAIGPVVAFVRAGCGGSVGVFVRSSGTAAIDGRGAIG
jgi:hypothetical protein